MIIELGDYEAEINCLYCGRTEYTEQLVYPRQGRDRNGQIKSNLFGVYATQYKEVAASHAVTFNVDGFVEFNKYGYLYILNPDDFVQLDSWRFISYDPVKPITFEIVKPIEYLHNILNGEWQGTTSYGTKKLVLKFNSSKTIKTEKDDYMINELSDPKVVAKEILHNEILEVIDKFEEGKIEPSILCDMLRKLDKNWEEFIE
ncbi:MAG: hypothetical protein M0R80_04235 [Proteobacteria bacterium]|jgi:hypothetical protein|nr:hypothetical protein [Pseudomonadota bacterium]